jgi:hypothetical protein
LLAKGPELSKRIFDGQKNTRCNASRTGFFVASARRMSWIRRALLNACLSPLQRQSHTLTAADAQGRQTFFRIALDHFVQQRHQHAATRCPDRVAEGDGAAVDVDLVQIPLQILGHRQRLRGKSFVGFDQVQLPDCQPALSRQRRVADTGPMPMIAGSTPALA